MKNTTNPDILQDPKKSGRERPWRAKKMRSLAVADSFDRQGEAKRAGRVRYCGTYLEFTTVVETGERFLSDANFCRERLCPMCQWRRSLKVFYQVSRVMDVIGLEHKNLVPLFLTLTVRNCDAGALAGTLDRMFRGWHFFVNHRTIRNLIDGWFRALEITYDGAEFITVKRYERSRAYYDRHGLRPGDRNPNYKTFHPHFHAVVLVDKSYFESGSYMETPEWARLWRVSLDLDYDPVCDIRRVKNPEGSRKGIVELSKYTVKDTEFVSDDKDKTDYLVGVYNRTLKGRRLYAFGGIMKKAAAGMGVKDPAEGDLVHIGDGTVRGDVATVIKKYHWVFGIADYIKFKETGTSPADLALAVTG